VSRLAGAAHFHPKHRQREAARALSGGYTAIWVGVLGNRFAFRPPVHFSYLSGSLSLSRKCGQDEQDLQDFGTIIP